jgi:cytochrome bd-type quinol oxidase subunit 2
MNKQYNQKQMKKSSFKKGLFQVLLFLGVTSLLLAAFGNVALAQLIQEGDVPSNIASATGGEGSIRALILRIVDFFLLFLGLIAVIMIIYGGVTYVTAAGNEEKVGKAKKIIMYAIIGIVIVLISFALVNTVIRGAGAGTETA